MARLGDKLLTRRRYAPGAWIAGTWTPGAATDSPFTGSVQPLGGRDRQVLPEGIRSRDGRKVYTDRGTLRTDDQHTGNVADEVLVNGIAYTVVHVDDSHELIEHDRAFLVRRQEEEAAP